VREKLSQKLNVEVCQARVGGEVTVWRSHAPGPLCLNDDDDTPRDQSTTSYRASSVARAPVPQHQVIACHSNVPPPYGRRHGAGRSASVASLTTILVPTITRRYAQRIKFCGEEFIVSSAERQPDTSLFPMRLDHETSSQSVEHSEEEKVIWSQSRLLAFGSYGFVREYTSSPMDFPVVKLAHQTPLARQLMHNEFSVLSELSSQCLPVVKVHSPLEDRSGIFGFSMQKLFRINPNDLPSYGDALKDAIIQLHSKGFVHGDVHPSNIMRTKNHEIRLIDLSHAGKVGQAIPDYHPARTLKHWHTFEAKMDLLELEKIMKL